ncbi:MAG: hypothetical protein Q8914_02125 [Bacteroidota bacterium]|nr:hypothetical protein [Bacteroidota bacterium]
MKRYGILCLCSMLLLFSCKDERFDVPGKPTFKIKIHRFDQAFQTEKSIKDSAFLDLYANDIMGVGHPDGKMYQDFYEVFHSDTDIIHLYDTCQLVFKNVKPIEKKLTWAFYRLRYFFPEIPLPKVYMHISAYAESIISAPGILSASLDKYLGVDYPMYQTLFQPYQSQHMYPDKLVTDYMAGWIRSELTPEKMVKKDRLLDYLLYEGKMMYLLKIILPNERMEHITAFTNDQLKWCRNNEKQMWNNLLQLHHLYSSDRLTIAKYIEDAPTTAFFPKDSPGRAITWVGYRIIDAYMENNPKVTLQGMIYDTDAQGILAASCYHP